MDDFDREMRRIQNRHLWAKVDQALAAVLIFAGVGLLVWLT